MRKKGWIIDSFRFPFNEVNYIVLVILYSPEEEKGYALVKLDFLLPDNFKHHLFVPANSNGLICGAMDLRIFFRIPPDYEHLGDALRTLTRELGYCTPTKVNTAKSQTEKKAITHQMIQTGCEEPDKIYCYTVKRNPIFIDAKTGEKKQAKRTPENDSKTRMLRRTLYERLGKDSSISFCYSDDPAMSRTDEEILSNWTSRKTENEYGMAVL